MASKWWEFFTGAPMKIERTPLKPEQLVCEICGGPLLTGERLIEVGTFIRPGDERPSPPGRRGVHLRHLQDVYVRDRDSERV